MAYGAGMNTSFCLPVRPSAPLQRTNPAAALEWLCQRYWHPLYALARRYGRNPHAAEDSTQAFFTDLIARAKLAKADPNRGRFRYWLRECFENHLKQEDVRDSTIKRGGGYLHISLDSLTPEERDAFDPRDPRTPDQLFQEAWLATLSKAALAELENEYTRLGKADWFGALRPFLVGDHGNYAELATALGKDAGTVRVLVHRLRQRYHELFRAELAQTVATEAELEAEERDLRHALSN